MRSGDFTDLRRPVSTQIRERSLPPVMNKKVVLFDLSTPKFIETASGRYVLKTTDADYKLNEQMNPAVQRSNSNIERFNQL